jgi:hypothetical protein
MCGPIIDKIDRVTLRWFILPDNAKKLDDGESGTPVNKGADCCGDCCDESDDRLVRTTHDQTT